MRQNLPALIHPERILEFGPGRSTRVLSETFPEARIDSVEHQQAFYIEQKVKLQDLPQVTLHYQPLDSQCFYSRGDWSQGLYDLILIDGPPKKTKRQVRAGASCIFPNVVPGGFIILDDSHRRDEKEIIAQWVEEFGLVETFNGSSFSVLKKPVTALLSRNDCLDGMTLA